MPLMLFTIARWCLIPFLASLCVHIGDPRTNLLTRSVITAAVSGGLQYSIWLSYDQQTLLTALATTLTLVSATFVGIIRCEQLRLLS